MASSSDITEIKRYLVSNGICVNCSAEQGAQCTLLYDLLHRKIQSGTLTSSEITELKRLILSNISCAICMTS